MMRKKRATLIELQEGLKSATKVCVVCGVEKEKKEFHKRVASFDGLRPQCKECKIKIDKEYRLNNLEKLRQYDKERSKRPDRILQSRRIRKKYEDYNLQNNISFRISKLLRARLGAAIKGKVKKGSFVRDLGCSMDEFKLWLEQKFYDNPTTGEMMTWENQGKDWEIDHVIPLMSFNLEDREQFLKACHYSNLQPLWHEDHARKTANDMKIYKSQEKENADR